MRNRTSKYTSILLLDPLLSGLITPITLPVIKFWVDQKLDPILFGYAVGAEALLILIFYQALDWLQERRRRALNDPDHITVISYPLVIAATILGYAPILLYAALGVNGYFIIAIVTGSFYHFCVRNHLRYLKRRLFTLEERELFDRKADKTSNLSSIGAMLFLACFVIEPARLEPAVALVGCYLLSDIGLLTGLTYFFCTLDRPSGAQDGAGAELERA
ncbi:MAG: hypothetical protein LBH94_00945 [Deltaproteobacteria bacterium]|jgi:hypothetical protein|nr:hypothetical protein [Deltaproteobacteria bacterium]